ncbi:MAG: DUF805 domain-containing protein [Agathobacter sp.]
MSFVDAIKSVFTQYVGFNGRARRSEYWYFVLFNFIVSFVLSLLGNFVGFFSILGTIWSLAVLLPSLAVCIRRLHDIGKAWTWFLLVLIPLVGQIILIVFFCQDSQPGENQYGPNPKGM